uniref:Uncharacterized protein n=1 Tax=Cucumis sativus TaxID=3659 RepID=A0A0A0LBL4_CUCSA
MNSSLSNQTDSLHVERRCVVKLFPNAIYNASGKNLFPNTLSASRIVKSAIRMKNTSRSHVAFKESGDVRFLLDLALQIMM